MADAAPFAALVTGASGFIGGHLARRLVAAGCPTRLFVRHPERLPSELRRSCEVVAGDLADADALRAAVCDVDVIFHCAANVATWDQRDNYHAANVAGVENLLQAIAAANPRLSRLVHFSTVDVYGFPDAPCAETRDPRGAGFGYGESKLRGEMRVREECQRLGIDYTILRPCNVVGPGSQFIARIGDELKSGVMLTIDGGRANAGLLDVDNLVDYALWAARAATAARQCYNVRDDYDVSWKTFITTFRAGIHGHGLVIDLPYAAANAVAVLLESCHRVLLPRREPLLHRLLVRIFGKTCAHDAAKIRADSGITGKIGFEETMRRSMHWYLHG